MLKLAFYGKGGIGKSTIVSNLAAAWAEQGLKVMQIGCDPKADSTAALHGGKRLPSILDLFRKNPQDVPLDAMVHRGDGGVLCVEAGGPTPGTGCAGRGIIMALEKLENAGAYRIFKPDLVLYDVLGDVVCGGFSMPMRRGYADKVCIITSGENMSIYAAANIAMAVSNFQSRGYAELGGIILNRRNVPEEESKVRTLAGDFHTKILGTLERSPEIQQAENLNKTVIASFPEAGVSRQIRELAQTLYPQRGASC